MTILAQAIPSSMDYLILIIQLATLAFAILAGLPYLIHRWRRPRLRTELWPMKDLDDGKHELTLRLGVKNKGRTELGYSTLRVKYLLPRTERRRGEITEKISFADTLNDKFLDLDFAHDPRQDSSTTTIYPEKYDSRVHASILTVWRSERAFVVKMKWMGYEFIEWPARSTDLFEFANGRLEEYEPTTDFHARVFIIISGRMPDGTPKSSETAYDLTIRKLGSAHWGAFDSEVEVRPFYESRLKGLISRVIPKHRRT
jgi:hypothetical protein